MVYAIVVKIMSNKQNQLADAFTLLLFRACYSKRIKDGAIVITQAYMLSVSHLF